MTADARFRALPSVGALAGSARLAAWRTRAPAALTSGCREILAAERASLHAGSGARDVEMLADDVEAWLRVRLQPGPRRVINATGIVVHTNLGRAPLSAAARAAMARAAGSCDLELDLHTGRRGSRQDHLRPLLTTLCGAEDALVVGNNAAAVLLCLTALCKGGEVLVSRGEAVEIGGGFRIPEVMRLSGARMVDVGTTNRTRAADYAAAVTARTRAIVRVHPSNFAQTGFVARPTTAELAAVAAERSLLLIEDAGSGALVDPGGLDPALRGEPVLADVIGAGGDLVTASADKLCGGPQAGLIAGRRALVERLRRHPLYRALRPDKLVLAALGATLAAWLDGEAMEAVPVARMLARSLEVIEGEAQTWAWTLLADGVPADLVEERSESGGGSLPGHSLETRCVSLPGPTGRLLAALRATDPPVIARAARGRVLLDPRTVAAEDVGDLLHCVRVAWESVAGVRPGRASAAATEGGALDQA